jgi:hypothetical protein
LHCFAFYLYLLAFKSRAYGACLKKRRKEKSFVEAPPCGMNFAATGDRSKALF